MPIPDDDFTDLTGRKIGDYEMVARIGIGGMGVVYEGRHPLIGKRVAVKFLLPSLSKDKELVDRFVAEARSVNAIGHRGIVDIFNFGVTEEGTQYFVMEFLEGRPFDQVIAKESPMHPALALRYLEEILDALQAAHAAGVIHRDIKPSNIFLVESARARPYVKLLDFGIAKSNAPKTGSTPQTRQSVVIGTPEYIAPEQAQGKSISAATDLYAVGCMAFELLTGRLPFRGENPLDTMFKHVVEATPHVRAFAPDVPVELDELIFRMMAKKPDERPASAQAVLDAFEQLRGSLTLDASHGFPAPVARTTGSTKPIQLTQESGKLTRPPMPTGEALAAMRPSPVRYIALGAIVVAALGLTLFAVTRPKQVEAVVVAPPPPAEKPRVVEVFDAGAVAAAAVVDPLPQLPDDPVEAKDAGLAAAKAVVLPPPPRRGITAAAVRSRIAALDKKLEQREAARGEALPVLRSFLKEARDDAAKANTDAERRDVWLMLDDVARQIER